MLFTNQTREALPNPREGLSIGIGPKYNTDGANLLLEKLRQNLLWTSHLAAED